MKRCLILVICCCLLAGAACAENLLYPGLRWESLLETAWEAEINATAGTVMPLDETRTEELNGLLSHLSLRLFRSPRGEGSWSAVSAGVDGAEAFRIDQWTDGTRTVVRLPGDHDPYASEGGDPLALLFGGDLIPEEAQAPDWAFTWLADADGLAENLAALAQMKPKKVRESVQSVGTAVQQLSWKTGKEDADTFWQAVVAACPEGALRDILAGCSGEGKQSLVLLCGAEGQVMKVTYTGRLKPGDGETRQVSLTWRRRRDETVFDKLTLRTPTDSGSARNNLVLQRSCKDTKNGRLLKTTLTVDFKEGKDRDHTECEIQLTAAERLTGTVKITREQSGAVEGKKTVTLKPDLTVGGGEPPLLQGSVAWQMKEDGHLTGDWDLRLSMGPLSAEVPALPDITTDVDAMTGEQREAAGLAAVRAVTPVLIRALVLLPPEDTLFLSRELLSWDEIVSAAQSDGQ